MYVQKDMFAAVDIVNMEVIEQTTSKPSNDVVSGGMRRRRRLICTDLLAEVLNFLTLAELCGLNWANMLLFRLSLHRYGVKNGPRIVPDLTIDSEGFRVREFKAQGEADEHPDYDHYFEQKHVKKEAQWRHVSAPRAGSSLPSEIHGFSLITVSLDYIMTTISTFQSTSQSQPSSKLSPPLRMVDEDELMMMPSLHGADISKFKKFLKRLERNFESVSGTSSASYSMGPTDSAFVSLNKEDANVNMSNSQFIDENMQNIFNFFSAVGPLLSKHKLIVSGRRLGHLAVAPLIEQCQSFAAVVLRINNVEEYPTGLICRPAIMASDRLHLCTNFSPFVDLNNDIISDIVHWLFHPPLSQGVERILWITPINSSVDILVKAIEKRFVSEINPNPHPFTVFSYTLYPSDFQPTLFSNERRWLVSDKRCGNVVLSLPKDGLAGKGIYGSGEFIIRRCSRVILEKSLEMGLSTTFAASATGDGEELSNMTDLLHGAHTQISPFLFELNRLCEVRII